MIYKRNLSINFILVIILSLLYSCNSNPNKEMPISIDRFEIEIMNYEQLPESLKSDFRNKYADIITIIYGGDFSDSLLSNIPNSMIYKTFATDVSKYYPSIDSLSIALAGINKRLISAFPTFKEPRIKTYITQFNQSIITTDTTALIALNQYLGAEHKMYGYYEPYQRLKKVKTQITFDYTEAIIRANIEMLPRNKDTLLDQILYEGLIAYLITDISQCKSDVKFLHYTPEQMAWCEKNETSIWKKILSQDILYSKSKLVASQMLSPAPFTSLVANDSPSELGRWIGYKIILNYIRNNNIENFDQLSSQIINSDSQTILMKAKYDGQ